METKICSGCKELKEICLFQKNNNSKDGFRSECKECSKERKKLIPKKILNGYDKKYREKNRGLLNEKQREYYQKNREKELLRNKIYRNKKIIISINKKSKSPETWQKKNKVLFYKKRNEKYKNDILYKLSLNVRNRLNSFLKLNKISKKNKTFDIVGCDSLFLKRYIENKFVDGMSWDNRYMWHIDHIIPLSSAKTEEEIYKLCDYTNLQPLWIKENLSKGSKILK